MPSVAGAVPYELFKSLVKYHLKPFLVREKYVLIHIGDDELNYLSVIELPDGDNAVHDNIVIVRRDVASKLLKSINIIYKIKCPYCHNNTAYVNSYEACYPGEVDCQTCHTQFLDVDNESEEYARLIFSEVELVKLFPRWRWKS